MNTGSGEPWSKERRAIAEPVAAALYGVVGIMNAELAVSRPEEYGYAEVAVGALLVGVAVMLTKIFYEVAKKETEIGMHLPLRKAGTIFWGAVPIMLFPLTVALLIALAGIISARWAILLDVILYGGMLTVFTIGFTSSFVLDNDVRPALARAVVWTLFSAVLVIAKKLT